MKLNRRIAAVVTAALLAPLGVIVTAGAASAHDNTVSGSASCASDGTHTVVWTISNDYGLTEVGHVQSFNDGSVAPLSVAIGKNGSGTVTQSGITKNVANINIHGVWSDGFTKDDTGHVSFDGNCVQHTTVNATFTEGSVVCDGTQAAYTDPSYTKTGAHVSWVVTGSASFGGTIKLVAKADDGWVIDGTSVFHHTFDAKPNAPDCRSTATPVAPKITQPACTGPGQSSDGSFTVPDNTSDLKYTVDGNTVYVHVPVVRQGDVKLAADLGAGWVRDSDVSAHFVVKYDSAGDCIVETVPVNPVVVQSVCTGPGTSSDATITPGETTGIVYTKDGTTVTATLVDGYKFGTLPDGWVANDNGTASFKVDLTPAGDCLVETTPSITVTQAECTGQGTSTGNDGYTTSGEFVTYSPYSDAQDAVVTATPAQGYKFGTLPDGWTLQDNGSATFTVHYVVSSSSQCVVATAPSATPPTCETDGALVIPNQTGVVYGQKPEGNGPGVYHVWAHAADGFILTGKHYWKITVLPRDRSLCTVVTPVTPVPTAATCADGQHYPLPTTEGITYAFETGEDGQLYITATATSGNHFSADSLNGFTLQGEGDTFAYLALPGLAGPLDCVSAVTPGIDQGQCSNGVATSATVTLVAAEGISYTINGGAAVRGGTFKVSTGDVHVVALADEGKTLVGTSSWTVKAKSVTCVITQIVKHPLTSIKTLAFTGSNVLDLLGLAAVLLFLGIGAVAFAARNRRNPLA